MHILIFILTLFMGTASCTPIRLEMKSIDACTYELTIIFDIDAYDGIYEQYLTFAVDDPAIIMSKAHCSIEPSSHYSSAFKESKTLFMGPCDFSTTIKTPSTENLHRAQFYGTYQLVSEKHSKTICFPLGAYLSENPVNPSTSSGRTGEKASRCGESLNLVFTSDTSAKLSSKRPPARRSLGVGWVEESGRTGEKASRCEGALNLVLPSKYIEELELTKNTICHPVLPEPVEGSTGFKNKSNQDLQIHIDIPTIQEHKIIPKSALPFTFPLGFLSILCAGVGIMLLFKATHASRLTWRTISSSIGMALLATSIVVAAKAYQAHYQEKRPRLIVVQQ